MAIASIPGGTGSKERSQDASSCKADGECCHTLVKLRGHFFLLTCFALSAIIFMAVDQFSHMPRFSTNDGAYYKQSYKQSYNHGANRGPHLGQKPRSAYGDAQPKSRKLLNQVDWRIVNHSKDEEVRSFSLFDQQHASLTVPLD